MTLRALGYLTVSAVLMGAPGSQAPWAPWRTIQTAHYRIHYPPVLAGWAADVAGRIEGIHAQVTAVVGYTSPEPVQVVLVDPRQEANGSAVPLLTGPYVMLMRTEPLSDNIHGAAMSSWTELVVTHELTHIHHLMRPSGPQNVFTSLFALPVGPVAMKAPRWVMEGYATLVEGRITGSGRPHSPLRAAILRQWAVMGKLPAYEELNQSPKYLGAHMAYLAGSAYLEWLERQRPAQPDILQRLWKQLASRRGLSFPAAFKATFGFTAQDGYQRFQAETSHDALAWETRIRAQGLRQGELWLRAPGTLTDLAVSPDGQHLLASLEDGGQAGLRVWDLAVKPKPVRPPKPDPLNGVEDAPPEWHPPTLAASLPALDGQPPQLAQWVSPDTILFQLKRPDAEGTLHRQPALWHLRGSVDRHPGDLPSPRWRTLEPLHRDGRWVLELHRQAVPLPGQAAGRAFVDEPRQQILAGCELDGVWNLVRIPYHTTPSGLVFEPAQRLTRTVSAAWNPAPSPDGHWLYYTSLDARGMEIRKLDLTLPPLEQAEIAEVRTLTQATVMPAPLAPDLLPRPVPPPPSHPYRARENLSLDLTGGVLVAPAGHGYQLGLAGQDLLGRLSWQALAGFGDGAGPRGAAVGVSSTAWSWKPSLNAFSALERPSLQSTAPVSRDQERQGLELAASCDDLGAPHLWASPVLAWERDQHLDQTATTFTATRSLAGLRTGLKSLWGRGPWLFTSSPTLDLYEGSTRTGATTRTWSAFRASFSVHLASPGPGFTLKAEEGRFSGSPLEAFHLGGVGSSLVPLSLDSNRLEQPALPAFYANGDHFQRYRAELGTRLHAYLEGDALWNAGQERPGFQRVMGVEFAMDIEGPAGEQLAKKVRIEAGVHRPLDGTMRGRTVATLSLVVRP